MQRMIWLGSALLLGLAAGCSNDDDGSSPATGGDGNGGEPIGGAVTGGAGGGEAGGPATGGASTGGTGGGAGAPTDFVIRTPTTHVVDCTSLEPGMGGPQELADADTLCTFTDGSVSGELYVQATPVACTMIMSAQPTYEVVAALRIDGAVMPLPGVVYDYGGNHRNDSLLFDYGGKSYRYYHSSFGWGWRACAPMDCAQITTGASLDDGCTCDRTHPIICAPIQADGTHAPLDADPFAVCAGDLTCGGGGSAGSSP